MILLALATKFFLWVREFASSANLGAKLGLFLGPKAGSRSGSSTREQGVSKFASFASKRSQEATPEEEETNWKHSQGGRMRDDLVGDD